jgi:ABC-2 type transport system ATP-binding protein
MPPGIAQTLRLTLLEFAHDCARDAASMIETEHLGKRYGRFDAVADLTLKVAPGQVLALLGPNGAGKTTTMRMIAGFLMPGSGCARVCGHDVVRDPMRARRSLGYLPEGAPSYGELSVSEFLAFAARVRGLSGIAGNRRLDEMIERLQLQPVLVLSIETLSKGYRRRVCLAQAMLHDPPALILDEPTDGLDPNQQREVHALIRGMARDRAIIVSTHALDEVRAACNRVAILARGRLRAQGAPSELEQHSRYHHAVSFRAPASALARELLGRLPEVDAVEVDPVDGRITVFPRDGQEIFRIVVKLLEEQHVRIDELQLERGRLEDVFRSVTSDAEDIPRAA